MEQFLNGDHCLSIAAAFIAIVAACATLVNTSNGKADALANRYRELTKEFRAEAAKKTSAAYDAFRHTQLQKQIELFKKRVKNIARAQRCLFLTLGLFIFSIAAFIAIALSIIYLHIPEERVYLVAQQPIQLIAFCIAFGTLSMFAAIIFLALELREAVQTFRIETSDCLQSQSRADRLRDDELQTTC